MSVRESILRFLNKESQELSYSGGVLLSFIFHFLFFLLAIIALQRARDEAAEASQIFTVTLEGGQTLGGISQVPKPGAEKEKPKTDAVQETKANIKTGLEETEVEKEKNNSQDEEDKKEAVAIEEAKKAQEQKKILEEKKLAEIQKLEEAKKQKLKDEQEKKQKEEEKKQLEDAKKKKAEEDAKKADLAKKDMERKLRDRRLADLAQKVRGSTYSGESANAGGEGFGAAKLGGLGMGGGIQASAEFVAYQNALQAHVKSGWRWLAGRDRLICIVAVEIFPDGKIKSVSVSKSSGNSTFDDSVVRAVRKSDPVPAAPADLYPSFKAVSFKFDSSESY